MIEDLNNADLFGFSFEWVNVVKRQNRLFAFGGVKFK
jgi:hypothetical protein